MSLALADSSPLDYQSEVLSLYFLPCKNRYYDPCVTLPPRDPRIEEKDQFPPRAVACVPGALGKLSIPPSTCSPDKPYVFIWHCQTLGTQGEEGQVPAHTSSVREQDLPRALPHKYGKECLGPWECGLQSSHLCPVYQGGLQGRGASSHRKTAVGQAPSLRGRQGERKNNACPKDIYTLIPRS